MCGVENWKENKLLGTSLINWRLGFQRRKAFFNELEKGARWKIMSPRRKAMNTLHSTISSIRLDLLRELHVANSAGGIDEGLSSARPSWQTFGCGILGNTRFRCTHDYFIMRGLCLTSPVRYKSNEPNHSFHTMGKN